MIEGRGLTRRFGDVLAVDDASFQVERGDVYGFLGPNGAGKTTTIRMLVGLIRPTAGTAVVNGYDLTRHPLSAKASIGYMPEEPAFYDHMRARELVTYYGTLYGLDEPEARSRAGELLDLVGLDEAKDRKVGEFSHGMRKRTALAQALIHDPPVLLLDEPTGGLDPAGTAWFRDVIRDKQDQGTTIFLSSHLLHEVQQVCTRIGIIHHGRIIADDTPKALSERMEAEAGVAGARVKVTLGQPSDDAAAALEALDHVTSVAAEGDGSILTVTVSDPGRTGDLNRALVEAGADVRGLEVQEADLEEIFLRLTGQAGTAGGEAGGSAGGTGGAETAISADAGEE